MKSGVINGVEKNDIPATGRTIKGPDIFLTKQVNIADLDQKMYPALFLGERTE